MDGRIGLTDRMDRTESTDRTDRPKDGSGGLDRLDESEASTLWGSEVLGWIYTDLCGFMLTHVKVC